MAGQDPSKTEPKTEPDTSKQENPLMRAPSRVDTATSTAIAEPNEKKEGEADEYPSAWKISIIVLALDVAVFLVALDQTIIATAIPKITDRFKSVDDIGWYGSAYFLTSTALQPTYGRIYKIFNVSVPK
jgi:hypothetical protein